MMTTKDPRFSWLKRHLANTTKIVKACCDKSGCACVSNSERLAADAGYR